MNYTKLFFTILMLFFLVPTVFAQPPVLKYPDSIRIEFTDHKAIVLFEMREYKRDKESLKNFPSLLGGLLEHIRKSIPESEISNPHTVEIVLQQEGKKEGFIGHERMVFDPALDKFEITIQQPEKEITQLTVKDYAIVQLLVPGWELTIRTNQLQVTVYAQNFEALRSLAQENFDRVITAIEADLGVTHLGKKGIHTRLVYQNGAIVFSKTDYVYPGDMLGLHAGAGAGVFRDAVYPELNFSTALYFTNRYRKYTQRIAAMYELKFFTGRAPEGTYKTLPNSFLSLSYSRNFSNDRPRWTGAGVGYLLTSNGDIYSGKTIKFFFESDIGSTKLNLVPEFYLTNDFKKFAFGVKVRYTF